MLSTTIQKKLEVQKIEATKRQTLLLDREMRNLKRSVQEVLDVTSEKQEVIYSPCAHDTGTSCTLPRHYRGVKLDDEPCRPHLCPLRRC